MLMNSGTERIKEHRNKEPRPPLPVRNAPGAQRDYDVEMTLNSRIDEKRSEIRYLV